MPGQREFMCSPLLPQLVRPWHLVSSPHVSVCPDSPLSLCLFCIRSVVHLPQCPVSVSAIPVTLQTFLEPRILLLTLRMYIHNALSIVQYLLQEILLLESLPSVTWSQSFPCGPKDGIVFQTSSRAGVVNLQPKCHRCHGQARLWDAADWGGGGKHSGRE